MSERRGRRGMAGAHAAPATRDVNYRQLKNPLPPMDVFSRDEITNMHETALRTRALLPEAALATARDFFEYTLVIHHFDSLQDLIAKRAKAGGAPPES
ncbi:hypothetical protein C8N43_2047 [Litoreibacter ponti]|uniref:Uncharacterized protein n=1 Tax=Litoreibacter ponti TaxID=1510457 RepID=A0A2T6BMR5_9RHOB|nr:hypothetical protein [Litoreibacter ponti]PTX57380.1 hypothetical protein C8N43_2047 [Litoreibacter ponti]